MTPTKQAQGKRSTFEGLLRTVDIGESDVRSTSFTERVGRLRQTVQGDKPQNNDMMYCWKNDFHNKSGPNGIDKRKQ
jgi:hypothetical protein